MKNIHGDTKMTDNQRASMGYIINHMGLGRESRPHCNTLKAYKQRERRVAQLAHRATRTY